MTRTPTDAAAKISRTGRGQRWLRSLGHTTMYLIGEGGSKALRFALIIALAPLLSTEEFGYVNLYLSAAGLLAILAGLGVPNAVVRFYFMDRDRSQVIGTVAVLLCAGSTLVLTVGYLARHSLESFFTLSPVAFLAALITSTAIAFRNAFLAGLRATRRSLAHAVVQLSEPITAMTWVAAWYLTAEEFGHEPVLFALAAATTVAAVFGGVTEGFRTGVAWSATLVKPLLLFGLPLILQAIAMNGLHTIDQVIIAQVHGPSAAGIYALAYRFGMAMMILITAFSASWTPTLFECLRSNDERSQLDPLAQKHVNLLAGAGLVLMIGLPPIAGLVGGQEYAPSLRYIPLIVYGYLWFMMYVLVFGYLMFDKRTLTLSLGSLAALATNVALNYALIPKWGLAAAAGSTIVSYVVLFTLQLWLARNSALDIRYGRAAAKVICLAPVAYFTFWQMG